MAEFIEFDFPKNYICVRADLLEAVNISEHTVGIKLANSERPHVIDYESSVKTEDLVNIAKEAMATYREGPICDEESDCESGEDSDCEE